MLTSHSIVVCFCCLYWQLCHDTALNLCGLNENGNLFCNKVENGQNMSVHSKICTYAYTWGGQKAMKVAQKCSTCILISIDKIQPVCVLIKRIFEIAKKRHNLHSTIRTSLHTV